ncbi:Transient receptor potential channel pyrexia [Gryllus bimaculatus]|nr:Transient receptor potential channel pyrexia [Gryllus bimaculatus]
MISITCFVVSDIADYQLIYCQPEGVKSTFAAPPAELLISEISEAKMEAREGNGREDAGVQDDAVREVTHAQSEQEAEREASADDAHCARRRVERKVEAFKRRCGEVVPSSTEIDLRDAVTRGRLHDVRRLLAQGVDLDNCHLHGTPIVTLAVSTKKATPAVVALLLEHGADVNAVNVYGMTALHSVAIKNHSPACVRLLLEAGAGVDDRDLEGRAPLHWAAWSNEEELVRALLAAGADADLRCWGGQWAGKTPLDLATADAVLEMLRAATAAGDHAAT